MDIIDSLDRQTDQNYLNAIKSFCETNKITYPQCLNDFIEVIYTHTNCGICRYKDNNPIYFSNDYIHYFDSDLFSDNDNFRKLCEKIKDFHSSLKWFQEALNIADNEELRYLNLSGYKHTFKNKCIEYYKKDSPVSFDFDGQTYFFANTDDSNNIKKIMADYKLFNTCKTQIKDPYIKAILNITASNNYVSMCYEKLPHIKNQSSDKRDNLYRELELIELFFDITKTVDKNDLLAFTKSLYKFIAKWSLLSSFLYNKNNEFQSAGGLNNFFYKTKEKDILKDLVEKNIAKALKVLSINKIDDPNEFYKSNLSELKYLFANSEHFRRTYPTILRALSDWENYPDDQKISYKNNDVKNVNEIVYDSIFDPFVD